MIARKDQISDVVFSVSMTLILSIGDHGDGIF